MTVPGSSDSNPQAGASQTDTAPSNPQAGATTPDNSGQHPQAGEGQIDPGKYRETMRENQKLRERLKAVEEAEQAAQLAKLGETEKAKADAAKHQQAALEATQKYQALLVKSAIKDVASTMKFRDANDAFLHLMNSGELEYDDDGQPANADKLLKKLAESKPYLLEQASGTIQPTQQPGLTPANPSRSSQSALPPFDPKNPPRLTERATWDTSKR